MRHWIVFIAPVICCLSLTALSASPAAAQFGNDGEYYGDDEGMQAVDIASGVLQILGSAIDAASQTNPPPRPPYYPPSQPQFYPDYYPTYPNYPTYPSHPSVPSNQVPANVTPPSNSVPVAKPQSNATPPQLALSGEALKQSTRQELQKQVDRLDSQLRSRFDEAQRERYREALEHYRKSLPADKQKLVDEAQAALKAGNSEALNAALDQLGSGLGFPPGHPDFNKWRKTLVAEVETRARLDDLKRLQTSGASAAQVRQAAEELHKSLTIHGGSLRITTFEAQQMKLGAAQLVSSSKLMEVLNSPAPPGLLPGMVSVVQIAPLPHLPSGQIILVGPAQVVLVGKPDTPLTTQLLLAQDVLGVPMPPGKPVAPASGNAPAGVVVVNPAETGGSVSFAIGVHRYTLRAGYQQPVQAGVIAFDRGSGNGTARYTLKSGTYRFKLTNRGWDLSAKTTTATIDNSQNTRDFHYVIGGQTHTVRAGETRRHDSGHPIHIQFDQGKGGTPASRELQSGTYVVGLTTNGTLDLFPGATGLAAAGSAPALPDTLIPSLSESAAPAVPESNEAPPVPTLAPNLSSP